MARYRTARSGLVRVDPDTGVVERLYRVNGKRTWLRVDCYTLMRVGPIRLCPPSRVKIVIQTG